MIQVLHRALNIVELIAAEPDIPHYLGDIAEQLELNAATCARILGVLVARGYIDQAAPKKGYTLGPMSYRLAGNGNYRKDLVLIAQPYMVQFANTVHETVNLTTLHRGKRLLLCEVDGGQTVQIRTDLLECNVYDVPTGRELLAHLPQDELHAFIRCYGLPGNQWPGISSEDELFAALQEIRQLPWLMYTTPEHVVAISAPISDGHRVIAALGVYLPEQRFIGDHHEQLLALFQSIAQDISKAVSAKQSHAKR